VNFEFLEDEPELLVEKILSVDTDWIGNADYEAYGGGYYTSDNLQSSATKVPCLEGEWIVVCYSKRRKIVRDNEVWTASDWHRYYVCQIDFSQDHLFRMVEVFEHIYDAFQYLHDNQLVAIKKSDNRYKKQVNASKADIVLTVLSDFKKEEREFTYDELLQFFSKNSHKSEEISAFLTDINNHIPPKRDTSEAYLAELEKLKCVRVRRFLPMEPYKTKETKLTIKDYLDKVVLYKANYLWNT